MAFITAETRSSIVELAMGMLNQAPSTAMLNTLIAKSVGGASIQDLADYIATTDAFTAEYPATQTAREFATEMFGKLITGGTLDADINTAVIDLLEGLLTAGTTKAQGFVAVIEFLANPANASHPDLGDISQSFQNRADAAEYFSITKELGGSTDAELAAAIASVTSDAATLTAANTAADATASAEQVVAGQTFTLTTSAETLTGTAGADSFVAVVSAAGATGTTILPGDILAGGEGTDTLTISTAGAPAAQYTIAAIQTSGIENVMFNAFDTDNTGDGTVLDLTLMAGVKKVGVASGSATGDVEVTNAKSIVDVSLSNSAGDFKVSYPAAVTSALLGDQTQNIALANVAAGTLTIAGVEVVNVSTSLVSSTLADLVIDDATTLNITGDKNLTISADVDFKDSTSAVAGAIDGTVDASGLTGKLTIEPNAADNMKITGGSANDKFVMGAGMNGYDAIDGGDGVDTITMNAASITTQFAQTSNVEIVQFNASATAIGIDASKVGAANIIVDLNDANDGDGAKLASTITKADGKTIWIAKSVEDQADANDSDGTKLTITETVDSTDDTVNIVLSNIGRDLHSATDYFGIDEIDVATYETVNITANANALGTNKFNEVETLTATNAKSVTVTGTGSLETVLSATSTVFKTFDASGLAGALTLTAGAEKATYKLGASSSTLTMGSNLNASDTIVGGAGTADTVTATVTGLTATTGALAISDVERIYLTTSGANTLDMSGVTGAYTLGVTDNKQTIKGFDLSNTISLGLAADAAATSSEIDVTAADATGSDDTLKVTVDNTAGNVSSIIDASGIENLALTVVDDTQSITLNMTTGEFNAISIAMKDATDNGAVDLGTLHKNTTSVTSGSIGAVTASFANQVAPNGSAATFSGLGVAIQTVTGGAYADTFTIGTTGAITHVIDGGTGTDTTNITVSAAFDNAGSIDTENVNMTVANGADVDLSGGATFHSGVDKVVLTGGNSLSTFTSGTLHTNLKSFDASGFSGNVALTLAIDAADTTVSFTGGSLLTDSLSYEIDNVGTDVIVSTGIETLVVNYDASATVSLASTDAAAINVDVAEAATTATVSNAEGTLVRVTKAAADSAVTVSLADSTGSEDTLAMELDEGASAGALVDGMNINVADVETVSIKVDDDVSVDLSGLSMTTAGKTMGLTLTGLNTLTISALGTDVTTINASGKLAGGVVQTGRSTTGTVEYTGGAGNDTFIMTNLGDTLVGGKGTDTLDINYAAILGGINVNLASATNQIVSANGSAISGSVTGFENVDLSGYTGTFGALITSGSSALLGTTASLIGTANADQIVGGSGVDTITGGAGADTLTGNGGADIFVLTDRTAIDTITDFAINSDKVSLNGGAVAVVGLAVAALDGTETLVFDTIANLGALGVTIGDLSAGSAPKYAVASDTGAIFFDADGDWTAGSVQIGTIGVVAGLDAADFVI